MADSRSSLALSASGRFSPSPRPEPLFECRVCGATDYTVETCRGVEFHLRNLKPYQAVVKGTLPMTCEIFTCNHCAHVAAHAHETVRGSLLTEALFAARDLAERQFCRPVRNAWSELVCAECRTQQCDDAKLLHESWCRTGRVLCLLAALAHLDGPCMQAMKSSSGAGRATSSPSAGAEPGGVA